VGIRNCWADTALRLHYRTSNEAAKRHKEQINNQLE
jgi:hypothetical protein